CQQQKSYPWTF
nr:immunoglobulin light chain junction region [Macaca mulatta]